ncbi:cytochrome c oxidase assembly protein [Laceyella putida]|uniref:Cytochrome c oxidase assembly protein n=1 Tax=Laceyella putida TaxID=110101 RepID=A0ABW2RMM0_9BACL
MSSQEFFQVFLYWSNWDYKLNLVFLAVGMLYIWLTGPFRHRFKDAESVSGWKKISFLIGLILYYFALGSPLNLMAHELFSMHMLQMSFLYFVVPPLLLLGMPAYLLRPVVSIKGLQSVIRFFTKPLITLFFFNGAMTFYHVPVVFDTIMKEPVWHYVSHGLLLFAALCMWWPIVAPLPDWDRIKPIHKLGLIFADGFLLTPACAMITFTDSVLFKDYMDMSQMFPIMSPIHDQQLGGVIMKIMQEIVYITAIGLVFLKWIRQERVKDEAELREWQQQNNMKLKES